MRREHKLQMLFHTFGDTQEDRVMSFLRDRKRITASSAREKVLHALSAWLAVDELESSRSQISEEEFQRQLGSAIASLQGRLAYCQSLLEHAGGSSSSPSAPSTPVLEVFPNTSEELEVSEPSEASRLDEPDSDFAASFGFESPIAGFFGD